MPISDQVSLLLAIGGAILTWTLTVISGAIWLTGKFRSLEATIYREGNKHAEKDAIMFSAHATKIQRLELRAFGFTSHMAGPIDPPFEVDPN